MANYTIIADPKVKNDLRDARNFLNSRRSGFGKKFLSEYKVTLKYLQKNPNFQIRYNDFHSLPMKTFKYMIHFRIDEPKKVYSFMLYFLITLIPIDIGLNNRFFL